MSSIPPFFRPWETPAMLPLLPFFPNFHQLSLSPPDSPLGSTTSSSSRSPGTVATALPSIVPPSLPYLQDLGSTRLVMVANEPVEAVDGGKRTCQRCKCPNCTATKHGDRGRDHYHICHIGECKNTYRKTSHLRAHIRKHYGERPFACNWFECGKRFDRSDQLIRHKRTHTKEYRFSCPRCIRQFSRSDHLQQHLTSVHNIIVVD